MLEQISYLRKFWDLVYDPKYSWPMKFHDFSIILRTLKLAVFYKGINEINSFLVCLSNSFLRNGSVGISLIFDTMVDNVTIEKLTETFFPGKIIFGPNLGQKGSEWPQNRAFWIF